MIRDIKNETMTTLNNPKQLKYCKSSIIRVAKETVATIDYD